MKCLKVTVYTDGSFTGMTKGIRKTRGGWAFYLKEFDILKSGNNCNKPGMTNNFMELRAIYKAFEFLSSTSTETHIDLHTDSMTCKFWLENEKTRGKKIGQDTLVLIQKTKNLMNRFSGVKIYHVKAHTSGENKHSIGNRIVDIAAGKASKQCTAKQKASSAKI